MFIKVHLCSLLIGYIIMASYVSRYVSSRELSVSLLLPPSVVTWQLAWTPPFPTWLFFMQWRIVWALVYSSQSRWCKECKYTLHTMSERERETDREGERVRERERETDRQRETEKKANTWQIDRRIDVTFVDISEVLLHSYTYAVMSN